MSDIRVTLKEMNFRQTEHLPVVAAFCRSTCLPPGRTTLLGREDNTQADILYDDNEVQRSAAIWVGRKAGFHRIIVFRAAAFSFVIARSEIPRFTQNKFRNDGLLQHYLRNDVLSLRTYSVNPSLNRIRGRREPRMDTDTHGLLLDAGQEAGVMSNE